MTFRSRGVGIVPRLLVIIALLLAAAPAGALTTYYVDPDWGGSQTGAALTPWTSLTYSAWATINTALASDDVTVYFSASNASSNTNQASTTPLNVARTDN